MKPNFGKMAEIETNEMLLIQRDHLGTKSTLAPSRYNYKLAKRVRHTQSTLRYLYNSLTSGKGKEKINLNRLRFNIYGIMYGH